MTLHAGAALLLASGWFPELDQSARYSGSQQAITLEASHVEVREASASLELPRVQVQPGVAWIAEQRFVERPSVAADWDLPQVSGAEQTPFSVESSRASSDSGLAAADPLVPEPLPRTLLIREPQLPVTIPELPGVEATQPPIFYNNPPPRYPELAKQRGWEGDVLLRLAIDETGKVTEVTVERSSGYEILDAAAAAAVRLWRAEPARRWGRTIKTVEFLPVQFRR